MRQPKVKFDYSLLDQTEKLIYALRCLYRENGYRQFKMGKFEDYDLYSKNKDFLISDSLISFTDTNGKLKALKPDVTLSIIKSYRNTEETLKLCYDESVFRVSKGTGSFKELEQTGLECIGKVDEREIASVVRLAAESLAQITEDYVLEVTNLDILSAFTEDLISGLDSSDAKELRSELLRCVSEKNTHEIDGILRNYALQPEDVSEKTEALKALIGSYGEVDTVLDKVRLIAQKNETALSAIDKLEKILGLIKDTEAYRHLRLDFSLVNDTNYYNGITFRGYIQGIPSSVLSGGQYNRLMRRMKKKADGIGFAVYLDTLERVELPR